MTFDFTGVVNTIYLCGGAAVLVGGAWAAMRVGIEAWTWLTESMEAHAMREAQEQDEADNRRHGH